MNWEIKKAERLVTFRTGKLDSNAAIVNGIYPFFTCAQETYRINNYAFDTECVLLAGNNAAGIFPLKYYKGKFNAYQRTYIIEPINKNELDIRYFYFLLRPFLKNFETSSTGVTTKFLTMGILNNLQILLPSLPTQRKIAAILSAYDDLIENNNKQISLLEKMAEEIYKEWFVRMRFPGYKQTKFVKGIPEGWELKSFISLVIKNPSIQVDKSELKPYLGMEDLSVDKMIFKSKDYRKGNSGTKFQNNDVLFPRITPSVENGKRGFVLTLHDNQVGLGSTEFIVFREGILPAEYIYFLTCSNEFRQHAVLSMVGASGRQRVKEDCFDSFLIKRPTEKLLTLFKDMVKPSFNQIKILFEENIILEKTRDLLLSRLLSRKLNVENLDIKFPPSMES